MYGRPCPRVELHPDNRQALSVATLLMRRLFSVDPTVREFCGEVSSSFVSAVGREEGAEAVMELGYSVLGALDDEELSKSIRKRVDRLTAEMEQQRIG